MKKSIQTIHRIDAPIEKVWAQISKASGVNTWLPVITTCQLEGHGEGAKRICSSAEGNLFETILKVDHSNKLFCYSVDKQPFFPIENITGTMQLTENADTVQLHWDLEFTMADETYYPMVKEAIEAMYAAGAAGLETISI
jgi:uncharacterized protein YndB with AHSA1/START domain